MPYESALPNQNKGYAKQEKKDLMNDMPIDKRASGGSWMSKHSMISPLRHEREDKKDHLHGRIERKTGKPKPIINK